MHCQSSIFYRCLALEAIKRNITKDQKAVIDLSSSNYKIANSPDLYSENVTKATSIISAIPEVRKNLYHLQRDFLNKHKRVVMDGRDIGTVIAPDADLKIYITADIDVRAKRRYDQLTANGKVTSLADILHNLEERDKRDRERQVAPLAKADDAILIDSTLLFPEELLQKLLLEIDVI